MVVQKTLFDQAERLKQEGMEVSYRNADSSWVRAVNERLHYLKEAKVPFTGDDVLRPLEAKGIVTGNNSALGAIFKAHQRAGLIKPTGVYRESTRPSRHKAPIREWVGV